MTPLPNSVPAVPSTERPDKMIFVWTLDFACQLPECFPLSFMPMDAQVRTIALDQSSHFSDDKIQTGLAKRRLVPSNVTSVGMANTLAGNPF